MITQQFVTYWLFVFFFFKENKKKNYDDIETVVHVAQARLKVETEDLDM